MSNYKVGYDNYSQQPHTVQPQGYGQPPPGYGHTTNTTVIINQPVQGKPKRPWKSGKGACFDDIGVCMLVWFCEPCYGCHLVTQADEHCCLGCCCPGWLLPLRSYVRGRLGIEGSVMKDFCAVSCCTLCVMCQLARELKEARTTGEWFSS